MRLLSRFERAGAIAFLRLPPRTLRAIVGPPLRSPEGHELDLQSQALLWLIRITGEPEIHEGELATIRRRVERTSRILEPTAFGRVRVRRGSVPGGAGPRPVRVYTPEVATRGLLPGLVWFHGGGFVLGSVEAQDGVCRAIAAQAGIVVVSVDYRLAPEHRYPAGVDDAKAATRWVLAHGETFGIDPAATAVGGDSAGGNLAAVAAQALRGSRQVPALQVLVYPPTDARRREPSHRHFHEGFVLTARNIGWFLDHYVPDPSYVHDPGVSPLLAPDLSGLPEALILTAGFDPLRDEGRAYAEKMSAAGVDVTHVSAHGSLHGFIHTVAAVDESARMFAVITDRLRRTLFARVSASAA
jgi:acetyl esterase